MSDPEPETPGEDATMLAGLSFVVTGTLEAFSRTDAKARIEQKGGKVTGSVSGRTAALIAGAAPGSKLAKAEALGIPVLDESGAESPFQPTAEDHERRQSQRELRALVPTGIAKIHRSFQQLGVAALAAILLGFWTPVRRAPAVTAHEEG